MVRAASCSPAVSLGPGGFELTHPVPLFSADLGGNIHPLLKRRPGSNGRKRGSDSFSVDETGRTEERMLGAGMVGGIIARKERGEGIKRIARELGVDRNVKRWP